MKPKQGDIYRSINKKMYYYNDNEWVEYATSITDEIEYELKKKEIKKIIDII